MYLVMFTTCFQSIGVHIESHGNSSTNGKSTNNNPLNDMTIALNGGDCLGKCNNLIS